MIFAKFSVIWISLTVPLRRHFIKYFCRTVPDFHNTEELHNSRRSFCPGLFVLRSLSSGANWSAWSIDLYQHLFYLNLIRISRGILFARDRSDQFDSFLRFNINDIASEIPIVLLSTPGNVSVDFARCWESDKEVYFRLHFIRACLNPTTSKNCEKKHVHPISLPHYDWGPWGGRGPEGGWAPKSGPPMAGGAQIFALFSSLASIFASRTLKCARLELSGCLVKLRRSQKRRGFRQQSESPFVHIWGPGLQKTTKIWWEDSTKKGARGKKERHFGLRRVVQERVQINNHNPQHNTTQKLIGRQWTGPNWTQGVLVWSIGWFFQTLFFLLPLLPPPQDPLSLVRTPPPWTSLPRTPSPLPGAQALHFGGHDFHRQRPV